MTSADRLLARIQEHGVKLYLEEGRLKARPMNGGVPQEVVNEIRENRVALKEACTWNEVRAHQMLQSALHFVGSRATEEHAMEAYRRFAEEVDECFVLQDMAELRLTLRRFIKEACADPR